ncbi:hypothetical protein ACHAW5_001278 [Stephanodiscus triporus]|uniref:Myb-like domain-containing protein n=1 Tax=Stephanodiscus triporus TaxID=2934178 RepID=A0ABD3QF07_9STRA
MRVVTRTIEQTKRHGREYLRNVERGEHIRTGYWTKEEHDAFLLGLKMYGEDWEMIAIRVATRTIEQTRRHAREYSKKKAVEGGWDRTSSFGGRDRDDVVPTVASSVDRIICDDREEREEEEEEEDSSEEDGEDEDGDEGSRLGEGQESGVAEDVSINADGEGKASSGEDESIENYVDDGSDPDVVSQSVNDASSDEQMSGGDNSIDDGSISGRRSDSKYNEDEEDQSVEHGTSSISVNRLFSRRFSGKMFSHAMNRPISMTSGKKATSRFKQWMGRRNIAAPVRPPTAKKRQLSLQQERWQSNFAALKAYKDKYGDTFVSFSDY